MRCFYDRTQREIASIRCVQSKVSLDVITRSVLLMLLANSNRHANQRRSVQRTGRRVGDCRADLGRIRRNCGRHAEQRGWFVQSGRQFAAASYRCRPATTQRTDRTRSLRGSCTIDMMRRYCAIIQLPQSYLSHSSTSPFLHPHAIYHYR